MASLLPLPFHGFRPSLSLWISGRKWLSAAESKVLDCWDFHSVCCQGTCNTRLNLWICVKVIFCRPCTLSFTLSIYQFSTPSRILITCLQSQITCSVHTDLTNCSLSFSDATVGKLTVLHGSVFPEFQPKPVESTTLKLAAILLYSFIVEHFLEQHVPSSLAAASEKNQQKNNYCCIFLIFGFGFLSFRTLLSKY